MCRQGREWEEEEESGGREEEGGEEDSGGRGASGGLSLDALRNGQGGRRGDVRLTHPRCVMPSISPLISSPLRQCPA